MLRSIKDLIGYPVQATDGDFGKVTDCLFDDREWGVRYLAVRTHGMLDRHEVLISPRDLDQPEVGWFGRHMLVNLSKDKIENSPSIGSDKPISQLCEEEYARYYRHQAYWEGAMIWGSMIVPQTARSKRPLGLEELHKNRMQQIADRSIRSVNEVIGYSVDATDGKIGAVVDLIVDTHHWRLRHLVIDTTKWLPGGKVLIDVDWVTDFDWAREEVIVDHSVEQIRSAPPFHSHEPVNRDYEQHLYDYYGRPRYWEEPEPSGF